MQHRTSASAYILKQESSQHSTSASGYIPKQKSSQHTRFPAKIAMCLCSQVKHHVCLQSLTCAGSSVHRSLHFGQGGKLLGQVLGKVEGAIDILLHLHNIMLSFFSPWKM